MHRFKALLFCPLFAALTVGHAAHADELSEVRRLAASGQPAAALQRLDRALAARPADPQLRFQKGLMLADDQRGAEAIAVFQQLIVDHPDLAEPYNNLAALQAASGDYAKARGTLEHALRANPSYATAHENLGDVHAALAAQSYRRALALEPGNATVPRKLELVRDLYKLPGGSSPNARSTVTPRPGRAAAAAVTSAASSPPVQ